MAGRIDEIELIGLAVGCLIIKPNGLRLDGNAALALQLHIIKHLFLHFARRQTAGQLYQPVGKCRLAVVNMCDNREITDVFLNRHISPISLAGEFANASKCKKKAEKYYPFNRASGHLWL